jgi:hypothetical protein
MYNLPENPPMVSGIEIRLIGAGSVARKPRWAIPLIASVAVVVFLIFAAGSANAAKISGTVTDTNGLRVTGATVTLYQNGDEYVLQNNPGVTDTTGYYEFSGLPDGAYNIQADKGGYSSPSDSTILAGSDAQVNLKIPGYDSRKATPTVAIYDASTPTPAPPTAKPTASPTPTKVPLPTPVPEPGFGLLLALASIGAVVSIGRLR